MATVIGIVSGKGGVGKTTLAINLGLCFAKLNEKIHVIDGDIKNPTLGAYLGMYKMSYSINDFLKKSVEFETVVHDYGGMKILPASLSIEDMNVGLGKLQETLANLEGYVIIDFPPGLSKDTINLMQLCDKNIIVTNPNLASIMSTIRFISIAKNMNKEIMAVVVNRTGKKYEISFDEIQTIIPENVIIAIPEDENIRKSSMMKKTVIENNPYSKSSVEIMSMASRILGKRYERPRFGRIKNALRIS